MFFSVLALSIPTSIAVPILLICHFDFYRNDLFIEEEVQFYFDLLLSSIFPIFSFKFYLKPNHIILGFFQVSYFTVLRKIHE